ncbi:hypothetical protein L2E69_09495 [Planktothrix agardhii 1806]|uniref:hypothetical protein n=1 Tax=Planktothrix agardhii TaxID=1160 RepID=UPI001F44DCE8|nr:hypothetical protein [Planktothrix agardhii]MCF3570871.1 hypothetical protein [Planktothrix agardhii 1805]MCF3587141.1 hypothetical protein [Planktothrix agardhii 1803]MCF3602911.1 hypothetical protein [Planktothrix agardhii 1804]MCF3616178.1 hypothetical protein [Planktothrix agardhii 1806]
MFSLFDYPEPSPLKRLSVEDGLLLNAERWQSAHAYHQNRQNLHYQSLNQPGIVCGLGVSAIPAPDHIVAKYRDNRWIKIDRGIAIDLIGNPIIVPEPMEFHIASEVGENPLLIYITIRYVNPETLYRPESKYLIEEMFRIDEKINKPEQLEVELCRIILLAGNVQITSPTNVFFPAGNHIDLRYRQQVMARHQGVVSVGLIANDSPIDQMILSSLSGLIQSLPALYPALGGRSEIGKIKLQTEENNESLNYDLLYLSYQKIAILTESETEILREYRETGGIIFIELTTLENEIVQLIKIQQKLKETLNYLKEDGEFDPLIQQLESELETTTKILDKQLADVMAAVRNLAQKTGEVTANDSGAITRQHPLRNQPFLFSQFPIIKEQEISLFNWGNIILVLGDLSIGWGLNEGFSFPRETIRTAQELGINFLHFAVKRRQLTQLLL